MNRSLLTVLLTVIFVTGCSAQPSLVEYKKDVYAFPVLDSTGAAVEHPFTGGFNVPRPQLIDIDADGDLDLFVQETSGSIRYFEGMTSSEGPSYVWRSDSYQGLDVDEWFRFVDLDQDGDYDLLAERKYSYIKYFRNVGTAQDAEFSLAADSLKDISGKPIFAERQNIPNLTDIDCDGNLDLFLGLLVGTVQRYEADGQDENGILRFRHITDRFQDIEIIAQFGSLHGANTLTFGDVDKDGDNDMFWGDFFERGVLYIENTGTCEEPSLRGEPVNFPPEDPVETSGYNASILADYDNDGDLDLFFGVLGGAYNPNLTTVENLYFLEHREDNTYKLVTSRFLNTIDAGSESIPVFADLDADGDMDFVLANKIEPGSNTSAGMFYYENTGSTTAPAFALQKKWEFLPTYHYAPAFGDLDGDGDLDMIIGTWNEGMAYYKNTGSATNPAFTLDSQSYLDLTRGSNSSPALVDIDADGDLDLFVGESSGTINYYENQGSRTKALFGLISDEWNDIDVGRRSYPLFADVDSDGDQDLLIGSENGDLFFYRNKGTASKGIFVEEPAPVINLPAYATPQFLDIDGDGALDVFSGGASGGVEFFRGIR